jgi:Asp-tRNA(Asn)/Glu-tRNA(Gln) amidotransferase A subunit family amidase
VSRISVFIFGRAHDDAEVLRVGAAIEKVMPYMLPETDLSSVMGS